MAQSNQGNGDRQTLSADDDTDAKRYGGPVRLSLTGTFGGGTAKLQSVDPSGVAVDVAGGLFTAITDTYFDFPLAASNVLTVNLAGSTTPALVVWIQGRKLSN